MGKLNSYVTTKKKTKHITHRKARKIVTDPFTISHIEILGSMWHSF